MQQVLKTNTQKTVRGEVIQEAHLVGSKAGGLGADKQRGPIRLMHNIPNPSVVALWGTPISMTSGECPSVAMTCKVVDAWVALQ